MLRAVLLAWALAPFAGAQPELWAAGSRTTNYVVGAKLPDSGIFHRDADGAWQHPGYNLPVLSAITADPGEPGTIYIAAGNGLIRARNGGRDWAILTGSDVTELRDVTIDRDGGIYFAHTQGVRYSADRGRTWTELASSRRRKFTEAVRIAGDGAILAGTEDGVWRTADRGRTWRLAGASGFQILRLEASPHDPCRVLAATQGGGVFSSRDCGVSFENLGAIGVGRNVYAIAFDPVRDGRIALGGFGIGVLLSEDGGKTWTARKGRDDVTAVVFARRLYAAVSDDAVHVSDDYGVTWTRAGMEQSRVVCMVRP